jgi:hypothetical protein
VKKSVTSERNRREINESNGENQMQRIAGRQQRQTKPMAHEAINGGVKWRLNVK